MTIIDFAATEPVFCLTEFIFGRTYSWLVSHVGHNDDNSNDIYVFNLAVNPEDLAGLGEWGLQSRLAQRPKPIRRIRANAMPILSKLEKAPAWAEGFALGPDELSRRTRRLKSDLDLRARLVAAFEATREQREPSPHVEEQIYDGFFGDGDQRLMERFHTAPWEDRLSLIERFDDPRLREIGNRLIHTERPDLLDDHVRRAHADRIARKLLGLDDEVPWRTLREAIHEANRLMEQAEGADLAFIAEHREYLQRRIAEAMRFGTS